MRVNRGKTKNTPMHTISAAPRALQRIADGYIDEKIIIVRRMLVAGKSHEEIGAVLGMKRQNVTNYVIRNGLAHLNRSRTGGPKIDTSWHRVACELRRQGLKIREIAERLEKKPSAVSGLFSRISGGLAADPSQEAI